MKSPLLDFRERSVHRASFIYGAFFGFALCGIASLSIQGHSDVITVATVAALVLAKYAHAKIPKKRRRKQVADAHPELPLQ